MLTIKNYNNVSRTNSVSSTKNNERISMRGTEQDIKAQEVQDKFVTSTKSLDAKQQEKIIYKARTNAAGWSILGGIMSTLYYYLRSDETIAEKYDLNEQSDKKFIDDIRTKQTIATIPGAVGAGILGWIAFKFFAKPKN